jgi:hypothetical protein
VRAFRTHGSVHQLRPGDAVAEPTIRLPGQPLARGVSSPANEVELELADYRSAGIPLIWVIIPAVRLVRASAAGGSIIKLRPGDTLTGDAVLLGFAVAVADLFPPAPARA